MADDPGQAETAAIPETATGVVRRQPVGRVRWREAFAAFDHRNYRIFFGGQVISLVGTWLQSTAEGWLVYKLSGSSVALGFIRFSNMLPFALLTLWGGIVADRRSKREILVCTQISSMILAFGLALLVWTGVVRVWHIAALGFLLGVVNAFDVPARQSFVVELVGREDLINGIALNSAMFNLARVVGPALAGMLIGLIGTAGCFFLNGLSYIAVIAGYGMLRLPGFVPRHDHPPFGRAIREAFDYVIANGPMRATMILVTTFSVFGVSFAVLMPVFAKDVLKGDAGAFGTLMAFNGLGALIGGVALASFGKRFKRRTLIYSGLFACCGLLMLFAVSRSFWLSCVLLLLAGFFMICFMATANTSVQLRAPEHLRGRIMGFYALCFLGMSSIGSLISGTLAKFIGAPGSVLLGATICIGVGLLTWHRIIPVPPEENPVQ